MLKRHNSTRAMNKNNVFTFSAQYYLFGNLTFGHWTVNHLYNVESVVNYIISHRTQYWMWTAQKQPGGSCYFTWSKWSSFECRSEHGNTTWNMHCCAKLIIFFKWLKCAQSFTSNFKRLWKFSFVSLQCFRDMRWRHNLHTVAEFNMEYFSK